MPNLEYLMLYKLIQKDRKFLSIELFVVPKICLQIANQKVKVAKTTYKHLVNLTLAENSPMNEKLNINLLIGIVTFTGKFSTEM